MTRSMLFSYFRGLAPTWRGKFPDGGLTPGLGDTFDRAVDLLVRMAGERYDPKHENPDFIEHVAVDDLKGIRLHELI